ncbi:major facilitator superfamily domain-containing protein [Paraphoma chrysanthemicola]|uniref:Major facilitator superfamily domain-containing protein n=1 Tax=Paraphoma chrysanthemicola TaxID=798071 RepID=A0A8K0W1V3_9PLEO|nr:major facilitator superfamily domain-containing protein [Paraphoma chrysanthemicola]
MNQQTPKQRRGMLGDHKAATTNVRSTAAQKTIDNPLLTFDDTLPDSETGRTELEEYVYRFAEQGGLLHRLYMLSFAARLARDKGAAMRRYEDEITEPEKVLLRTEKDKSSGFWKQAKFFKATIITASLGGMIQGWTQSVNNGTAYGMPAEFHLCITENCGNGQLWTFGMLNAIPFLSAGLFGTILADPLQENVLGRRGSVMLSCAITIASTIGASVSQNVTQLAICRAINGVALGAKASIVPIYSAEMSPEHIRGAILANWQLADAAGIFLGFLCNLLVVIYSSNQYASWRILTNTVLIPTVPLLVMIYLMPESPRYLMKHGRYEKALDSFNQIQTTPLLAARDLMYAHAQLDFESRMLKGNANEFGNLADRMDRSAHNISGGIAGPPRSNQDCSLTSLSPRQSIEMIDVGSRVSAGAGEQPRDSHQEQSANANDMSGRPSTTSSLEIDREVRAAMESAIKKENPYSYHIGVTGYYKRLVELWVNMRCRRALLASSVAMISQQMTGVNTIAFLGTIVWSKSLGQDEINPNDAPKLKSSAETAAIIGLAFGAANYLGGLPAYWLSDKIGRSIMLLLGLPNMAWSMLVFAFLFKISDTSVQVPLVSVWAVIFVLFYSPTGGTSPFSISAEVFPLVSREAGMAVAVAVNLLGAGILVLVFPFLMHSIGRTGSLSIFAGLNLVAFVLVYLFVPETKGRTLEELQYTFDLPTRWHVSYRASYIREHLVENWWRYLTRQKIPEDELPAPFYEWARIKYLENQDRS